MNDTQPFTVECISDDAPDLLCRFDKMAVGQVGVARRGLVPAVAKEFADQWQVFARHDGLAGSGSSPCSGEQDGVIEVARERDGLRIFGPNTSGG